MSTTRVNPSETFPDRLLTRPEAGGVLGMKTQTLANWANLGKGPRFVRINGRSVRYRMSDLTAYMAELETVEAVAA